MTSGISVLPLKNVTDIQYFCHNFAMPVRTLFGTVSTGIE